MRNKICLVTCYFGKLPNYFQLWLASCEKNPDITWLVVTDDVTEYLYPQNVWKKYITFNEVVELVAKRTKLNVQILNPYKLCDFKPLFGVIFQEELKGFTHWGHCDVDLIWGNLSKYITDKMLDDYQRLFIYGHLCIYKNTDETNAIYKLPYTGIDYKTILCSKNHFGFDEMKGMNQICLENNISWFRENYAADINFMHYTLLVNNSANYPGQLFKYEDGSVIRLDHTGTIIDEFAYIHLQKRKMKVDVDSSCTSYFITPDRFIGHWCVPKTNPRINLTFYLDAQKKYLR